MIEQQCWIKVYQEFLFVKFGLQMFMCMFCDRCQVIYNRFNDVWYKQYYCCSFDCQLQNGFSVVVCQYINYQFYYEVDSYWFVKWFEVFLDIICVKVNMIEVWNFFDNGINEYCYGVQVCG